MNKKTYSHILDHVARDQMAANIDLAPRILARIQKGKKTTMQPRMKVFVTAVLILLVLVSVLVSVPSVRAAIQRWFGYVPDIGLVSEGQIRVLAEPVSATRDGVTLRIEQVLVDSNQTTVLYSVEGLRMDMFDPNLLTKGISGCRSGVTLRLGEDELTPSGLAETKWTSGYQAKASYPALAPQLTKRLL